VSVTTAV